jgi:biotin transport system substrate-specific component
LTANHLPVDQLLLDRQSALVKTLAVLFGTFLLAASSHLAVPMIPVPMTMQTLAVTMVGALYGWRLGMLTVLAWLLEGAAGLPVFANGSAGVAHLMGPTAGYLLAFPVAAALVGSLVERGWDGRRVVLAFAAMLIGNAVCLALGARWLAVGIGMDRALAVGVTPFVLGGILKSILGAALLLAIAQARKPRALPSAE